ncbi:hypothetical protein [Tolypothrix sp. VBCCA 56010]|uniref:hypothetical protein n=1 Tax=Tolypothrix sp. VBCCA 56010 TaxID=3137731 RepID=UPI003D7DA908
MKHIQPIFNYLTPKWEEEGSQRVAVSPLGGVGFRSQPRARVKRVERTGVPVEVANPKGGSLRCSDWRGEVGEGGVGEEKLINHNS